MKGFHHQERKESLSRFEFALSFGQIFLLQRKGKAGGCAYTGFCTSLRQFLQKSCPIKTVENDYYGVRVFLIMFLKDETF